MKSKIIGNFPKTQQIDWSKKMIVENKNLDIIVLTTGIYNNHIFTGVVLHSENKAYVAGDLSNHWVKNCFEPLNSQLTIMFEN